MTIYFVRAPDARFNARQVMLAVLPLPNLSNDPQEEYSATAFSATHRCRKCEMGGPSCVRLRESAQNTNFRDS